MSAPDDPPIMTTGEALSFLIKILGYSGKKPELTRVGKTLALISGRELPYSYKYVHSVLNGSLEAGQIFHRAVGAWIYTLSGHPAGLVGLETIEAYGRSEWSGSQLGGVVRHCANPECNQKFLTDNNRKWCRVCHPPRRKA